MMNNQKFINFLGIASRAGKIIIGEGNLLNKIKNKKIFFLFLADDAGLSSSKTFHNKAKSYKIPFNDYFTKTNLSNAVGKKCTMIGISDPQIAKYFIKISKTSKGQ